MHALTDGGRFAQTISNIILVSLCLLKYLAEAADGTCHCQEKNHWGRFVWMWAGCASLSFFVCASILGIIGIISAQNMSLNVFSEIDSFAQKQRRSFSWQIFVDMQNILVWQCSQGCSFLIVPLVSFSALHMCFQEHFFISQVVIFIIPRVSSGWSFSIIPSYFRYFAFQSVRTWMY